MALCLVIDQAHSSQSQLIMLGTVPRNETRQFATTLDISATIVATAGGDLPSSYQGFDLVSPLSAGNESPRKVGIGTEYRSYAVVTPSWKLSYYPEQDEGRLWDRLNDPHEQQDLYKNATAGSKLGAVRDGLLKALMRWRAQQDPLAYLQANSAPGAQTATIAYNHTESIRGVDAELRLQQDALSMEGPFFF